MAINHYFQQGLNIGRSSEQLLHEDLIIECLQIYGFEVIYLPRTTVNQDDILIKISLCGLSALLIFQTFIHIGVNTSLLPTTGMTLPFLSYGGSSLIGSAVLAGIILNYTKIKLEIDE